MKKILLATAVVIAFGANAQNKITNNLYTFSDAPVEKNKSGEKRILLSGEATDFSEMEIAAITLKKKKTDGSSGTSDYERLVFVHKGSIAITINGKTDPVGFGSVALILPGDNVTITNTSKSDPATYYVMKYKSKAPVDITRGRGNQYGGSFVMDWEKIPFRSRNDGAGGTRQFFTVPTAMGRRLDLHATLLEPSRNSHDPHKHRAEELVLLLDADTEMYLGKEPTGGAHKKGTDGDLYYLVSNEYHAITNLGTESALYFAFQFE